MTLKKLTFALLVATMGLQGVNSYAQRTGKSGAPALVYSQENTGAHIRGVRLPKNPLPIQRALPDPLLMNNGKHRATKFKHWEKRRQEIGQMIQYYEIGPKPMVAPDQIRARMDGDTLRVVVTVGDERLELSSVITYPEGDGPFPLMIGTSHISLPKDVFKGRPIALMTFHEAQVNNYSQFGIPAGRGHYNFDRLYPELIENGAYSEWAWGLSRLIDGLQLLGTERTRIDMSHIGVTGCSYAGKMALFCGAFDERIALTIAQEPGGGGVANWRTSHELDGVEDLDHTDYHWFKESLKSSFHGDSVYQLPYDHHELVAMICPRAVLMLGNTDYKWLADPSAEVSMKAAGKVWQQYGIADRIGYSIRGNHPHCQLPQEQYGIVEDFIDRFLLGKKAK